MLVGVKLDELRTTLSMWRGDAARLLKFRDSPAGKDAVAASIIKAEMRCPLVHATYSTHTAASTLAEVEAASVQAGCEYTAGVEAAVPTSAEEAFSTFVQRATAAKFILVLFTAEYRWAGGGG